MNLIRKRYLFQFLIILIFFTLSIVFLLFMISDQMNKSLEHTYYKKLNVTKNTLKANIENYFENKSNLITTLSENEDIKKALIDFSGSFKLLEKEFTQEVDTKKHINFINDHTKKVIYDVPKATNKKEPEAYLPSSTNGLILQNLYILDNQFSIGEKDKLSTSPLNLSYDKTHKIYHQRFLNILRKHKFYDIFLIDTEGNIVYSVFKELDLGTNLKTDVYSQSSLARAYKKTFKEEKLCFCDFKPYEPSYNKPAAFFAMPVKVNGKKIGSIAFQISIDEVNNIATFNSKWEEIGLGKSGEAYLVGKDYLMRSDSRFKSEVDNKIVKKLDTTIGILNIKSNLVENALNNKNGSGEFFDYKGERVLSSFTTINIFDRAWGLIVEIDKNEVNQEIEQTVYVIIVISVLIISLLMVVLWFIVLKIIIIPIENFEKRLETQVESKTKKLHELNRTLQNKVENQIEKIRQQDKILLHQNRMSAIGEMMHNIAHQWRQPLSIITMHSTNMGLEIELDEKISKEDQLDRLEKIHKQAQYLSQIIDDFLSFNNSDSSLRSEYNLKNIFEKTEVLVSSSFEENQIKLFIDCENEIYLNVNENHLIQVFLNIFNNCKDAMVINAIEERYVFVSASKKNNQVQIKIKDSGGGIKDEILDKIFDPYTTTKHAYIGTGIALYMCYQLITTEYNGTIYVNNLEYEEDEKLLKGAEFIITLPLDSQDNEDII